MTQTIHMKPVPSDRGVTYVHAGLGAVTVSPQLQANIATATSVMNQASKMIPEQSIQIQTEFSKVAYTIAGIAGNVAGVAAVIPGAGTIVALVAGVVAAAAALLGKIFSRAKSKELDAERKQWDAANAQLRIENNELDIQYETLKVNMATLRVELSKATGIDFTLGKDNSTQGLGLCIFNCKAKAAEQNLNTSKQQYDSLTKAQQQKIQLIQELLKEWDTITKAVIDIQKSGNINAGLIVGLGLLLLGGAYIAFKD